MPQTILALNEALRALSETMRTKTQLESSKCATHEFWQLPTARTQCPTAWRVAVRWRQLLRETTETWSALTTTCSVACCTCPRRCKMSR